MINFNDLLENSYTMTCQMGDMSRLEYLADYIFDFTTYDGEMGELFASKALEVCAAISNGKTFEYIKDREQYIWYLSMVNMHFFDSKIDWGGSVRGAWWRHSIEFDSCGIFEGEQQRTDTMNFTREAWEEFVRALVAFATPIQGQPEPLEESTQPVSGGDGEDGA